MGNQHIMRTELQNIELESLEIQLTDCPSLEYLHIDVPDHIDYFPMISQEKFTIILQQLNQLSHCQYLLSFLYIVHHLRYVVTYISCACVCQEQMSQHLPVPLHNTFYRLDLSFLQLVVG